MPTDSEVQTQPVQDVMSDEGLKSAILAKIAEEQQAAVTPEPAVNVPSPTPAQAEGQTSKAQEPAPVPAVEPKPEGVTAEELMRKKGMSSIDDVAKSYSELEKKMSQIAQENSRLRQQVPMTQQPTYHPQEVPQVPAVPNDPNRMFLEEFARNPLETLAAALSTINRPIIEQQRDATFKSELVRLSSSPKTADFNLPEIQQEIQKVIQERPQMYLDRFGKVAPDRLEDLYFLAKGRLGSVGGQTQQTPNTVNKFSPVEGANVAQTPQVKTVEQMSQEELRAEILKKLQQGI